jgi:hypothetical protein
VIKRAALGLALSLGTVRALGGRPRRATTTGTSYDFAAAAATPPFFCTDIGCRALTGYTYTGAGTARPAEPHRAQIPRRPFLPGKTGLPSQR